MRGFERLSDLFRDGQGFVQRDRPFGDTISQRWAFDKFEDQCTSIVSFF